MKVRFNFRFHSWCTGRGCFSLFVVLRLKNRSETLAVGVRSRHGRRVDCSALPRRTHVGLSTKKYIMWKVEYFPNYGHGCHHLPLAGLCCYSKASQWLWCFYMGFLHGIAAAIAVAFAIAVVDCILQFKDCQLAMAIVVETCRHWAATLLLPLGLCFHACNAYATWVCCCHCVTNSKEKLCW